MTNDTQKKRGGGLLQGARVYLSGPMDFVASREQEKKFGWRTRVGQVLRAHGATVFDPWNKPEVRGLHEYGREDVGTVKVRDTWTFEDSEQGARRRALCSGQFWETLHIDLRMVDTSDFTIAYCPTNIYSVGTPHEIALCRQQRKPVLFVSPPVTFDRWEELRAHLAHDKKGSELLDLVANELPVKPNPEGVPSLWYMPLVGPHNFFDGFGFEADGGAWRKRFRWQETELDRRERTRKPLRPLLPFLEQLTRQLPTRRVGKKELPDDDWLLWDLKAGGGGGEVVDAKRSRG